MLKFDRTLSTYIGMAPRGYQQFRLAGPLWIKDKLWVERNIREYFKSYKGRIYISEHHESHAASAFFPSPFQQAAILTMDAVGEWATASVAIGRGADLAIVKEMRLVLVGAVFWWRNHLILPIIFWAASFVLIVGAIPQRLGPVERWWMQIGHWIGRFTTPIMTAFVFFGLLTPAGSVLRLFGANPLKARRSDSLWVVRKDGGRSDLKKHF